MGFKKQGKREKKDGNISEVFSRPLYYSNPISLRNGAYFLSLPLIWLTNQPLIKIIISIALHHVMGRGIDGTKIFINRKNRKDFLERLADLCEADALGLFYAIRGIYLNRFGTNVLFYVFLRQRILQAHFLESALKKYPNPYPRCGVKSLFIELIHIKLLEKNFSNLA